MIAWVVCGLLSFGWLRAKEKAMHLRTQLQVAQSHEEIKGHVEAQHAALKEHVDARHEELKSHTEAKHVDLSDLLSSRVDEMCERVREALQEFNGGAGESGVPPS